MSSTKGLIPVTAYSRAERYAGVTELSGSADHPLIRWWLMLCGFKHSVHDEVPWCSAFVNGIAWDLRLPRSNSALARSWLEVGRGVSLLEARQGFDVVVLRRGTSNVTGHVGFFAGADAPHNSIELLGGNQDNRVSVKAYALSDVLGIRRLREWA